MITILNNSYWLKQQSENIPNRIAIIDDNKKYTFKEIYELSQKASTFFHDKGIQQGNHVAIISQNNIEFFITVNALWFLNAIPVPLNIRLNNREILKLIAHSESSFLIISENKSEEIKYEKTISISLATLLRTKDNRLENRFDPNNIALMMYSSGSTGSPKCVQITFENLYESCKSVDGFINHTIDNVWLASLPFYHIGGFSILSRILIVGCSFVLSNSISNNLFIENIINFEPSLISLVPTMLKDLIDTNIRPWEKLRIAFLGGGPIDDDQIRKAIENNWPIATVYGSTETSSMVTVSSTENLKTHGLSVGETLDGVIINIVDEGNNIVPNGKIGEIVVTSKSVGSGYFNSPEVFSLKFSDGKYYTGDLGKIDENGNLHIIGRKDDMIISGGENINLNEIENYVKLLDQVSDCTTIKVKDNKWGESYILLIELDEKKESTRKKVLGELKKYISNFKQPKSTHFVNVIYQNELGKVDKNKHLAELEN